jgi:hypothetical protein
VTKPPEVIPRNCTVWQSWRVNAVQKVHDVRRSQLLVFGVVRERRQDG